MRRRKQAKDEQTAHSGFKAREGKEQGAGERNKEAEDDYKNRNFVPLLPKPLISLCDSIDSLLYVPEIFPLMRKIPYCYMGGRQSSTSLLPSTRCPVVTRVHPARVRGGRL
jgi:hypothetical protein